MLTFFVSFKRFNNVYVKEVFDFASKLSIFTALAALHNSYKIASVHSTIHASSFQSVKNN